MAQSTPIRVVSDRKLERWVRQIAREVVLDEIKKASKPKRLRPRARSLKRDGNLRRHFGAVDLGHATGVDNAAIDAELARAYNASHT